MSENTKNEATNKDVKREVKIKIEECVDFNPINDVKFLSSKGLCELVSEVFRNSFVDFEGSSFEIMPGSNTPMICLYFNHKKFDTENDERPYACSLQAADENVVNPTLRSLRANTRRSIEGDRYFVTEEGQSAISDFLLNIRSIYKANSNKPDWKKITTEVSDSSQQFYGNVGMQYTKISFLDPAKLVTTIFGATNANGDKYEYGVRVMRSMPSANSMFTGAPATASNNWMLAIDRVSEENVTKLAHEFGLSITSGLSIVR